MKITMHQWTPIVTILWIVHPAFPHSSQNAHARPTVALVTIQRPISLVVSTMGSIPTFLVELPHLLPIANDLEHRIALLLSTLPRTTKDLYDVTARYLNPSRPSPGTHIACMFSPYDHILSPIIFSHITGRICCK